MERVKEYLINILQTEILEWDDKNCHYVITPNFVITYDKQERDFLISFDIDISKDVAIGLYIEIQNHFMNEIYFTPYEDVVIGVTELNELDYFKFGMEAKAIYYNEIHENIELQNSVSKDTIFH